MVPIKMKILLNAAVVFLLFLKAADNELSWQQKKRKQ